MVWRIIHYIKHLFFIRHRHGHGIHSPYLFEFVNGVLFNALEIKAPETVMEEHRKLRAQYAFIKRSSVSVRHGFFLYRISKWFPAEMIVEMGTGMGISSLYLASGAPQVPLHTIEHDLDRASFDGPPWKDG
jgi:hypothetical protein